MQSSKTLEEVTADSGGTNQNISVPNQALLCSSYVFFGKLVNICWIKTSHLCFGCKSLKKLLWELNRPVHKPFTTYLFSSLSWVFHKIVVVIFRLVQNIWTHFITFQHFYCKLKLILECNKE